MCIVTANRCPENSLIMQPNILNGDFAFQNNLSATSPGWREMEPSNGMGVSGLVDTAKPGDTTEVPDTAGHACINTGLQALSVRWLFSKFYSESIHSHGSCLHLKLVHELEGAIQDSGL